MAVALAATPQDMASAALLFSEYADSLALDLAFQNFAHELATLPGDYAAPRGSLLLAHVGDALAGCCALRPLDTADYPNAAEMKRLYVRKAFRGFGLGRQLAEAPLMLRARRAMPACCWTPWTTWRRRATSTPTWGSRRSNPTTTTRLPGRTT